MENKDLKKIKRRELLELMLEQAKRIEELEKKHNLHPELREAHKALAREVITDLHGEEEYLRAEKISESLFSGDIASFTGKDVEEAFRGLVPFKIEEGLLIDVLVNNGICSSKREAREFITNGSITVNGEKITDLDYVINKDKCIENKYFVIRRGKKKYYLGTM